VALLPEFLWRLLSLAVKTLGKGYCSREYLHDYVRNAAAAAVVVVVVVVVAVVVVAVAEVVVDVVVGQDSVASVDHFWSFLLLNRQ
jgi:hypothetical protein